jgi:hypothetical protein
MSCVCEVSDEGLCYIVSLKIILCVALTSLTAVKVADKRRKNISEVWFVRFM